jgi:hypothetical protein
MASWWATLVIGVAVLFFGRRLFWLFVGAAGFAVGLHVGRAAFGDGPEWLVVVAALVVGAVGAVLAIAFQWLAVGLGGFAAGVHAMLGVGPTLGLADAWLWGVAFAAGILVAALLLWLWDPVLIVLSAVTGAALLTPLAPVSSAVRPWLFVGLLIVGIVVQARMLTPPPRAEARPRRRSG